MEQEVIPRASYWAVIPGNILHDPDLRPNAKLLYGEISALTNQEGYCFASNDYFAALLGVEERSVRLWLNQLQKKGVIRIVEERGHRNVMVRRKIYAGLNPVYEAGFSSEQKFQTDLVRNKNSGSSEQKFQTNIIENKNLDIPPKAPQGAARAKSRQPKQQPDWKPDRFSGLWNYYPVHKSKQAAIRAWDRLKPGDELIAEIGKALRRQMATDMWSRGIGIPYLATYLNGERWKDDIDPHELDHAQEEPEPDYEEDLPEWT